MTPPGPPPRVSFHLDDDGRHIVWSHECRSATGRWWHTETGEDSGGKLPTGAHGWTVQQPAPLTVTPSIKCQECGLHGFITDGVWRAV